MRSRVLQDPGVGQLVRCLLDAGPAQDDCADRQRAPVQGDHDRVAHALRGEQRQARADTGKASRLLACNLKVTRRDDQDLRALRAMRSELGRVTRQSPIPEVVTQALALVEAHPNISDEGVQALLHAAGLRQGQASTAPQVARGNEFDNCPRKPIKESPVPKSRRVAFVAAATTLSLGLLGVPAFAATTSTHPYVPGCSGDWHTTTSATNNHARGTSAGCASKLTPPA